MALSKSIHNKRCSADADTEKRYDFYFLGSHVPDLDRDKAISTFSEYAEKKGWKVDFTIFHVNGGSLNEHSDVYPDSIKATAEPLTFEDNIKREMQSCVLLDFKAAVHTGLSFRTIESVGYRKSSLPPMPKLPNTIFIIPTISIIGTVKVWTVWQNLSPNPIASYPPKSTKNTASATGCAIFWTCRPIKK
ncbi:hypothetical protein [Neisseria sicca]